MIDIVSEALLMNDILYSLCSNRTKDFVDNGPLEIFKSSIDVRVLLMPLYLGKILILFVYAYVCIYCMFLDGCMWILLTMVLSRFLNLVSTYASC
jgi:hypothetical protein